MREIHKIEKWKIQIILNQSLTYELKESPELPEYFNHKLILEKKILKQYPNFPLLRFSKSNTTTALVNELAKQMGPLL